MRHLVDDLQRRPWLNGNEARAHSPSPTSLWSPHNAQVQRLRAALPVAARVGTVDKFQGQEAPVTIYSMTTSSAEDSPRNLGSSSAATGSTWRFPRRGAVDRGPLAPPAPSAPPHPGAAPPVNTVCLYVESAHEVAGEPTGIAGQAEGNSA